MAIPRIDHLRAFYSILDDLETKLGGARTLAPSSGRLNWPTRGVYFFGESGENRSDSGASPRIACALSDRTGLASRFNRTTDRYTRDRS